MFYKPQHVRTLTYQEERIERTGKSLQPDVPSTLACILTPQEELHSTCVFLLDTYQTRVGARAISAPLKMSMRPLIKNV